MGSCESGLCTPHGVQSSGIIDSTGRVSRSDGTPSLVAMNPSAPSVSAPNGAQVFMRGSRAFGASGCAVQPPQPSSAAFRPSHGAPAALPEHSDDYLQVDIEPGSGKVQVIHASGQASTADQAALAQELAMMSDDALRLSVQNAQQLIQQADGNGITPIGNTADQVATMLLGLERELSRRAATRPHAPVIGADGNAISFIETAGAVVDYAAQDAAYGYGASGQAATTGGTTTTTGGGGGAATGNNAQIQTTNSSDKTSNTDGGMTTTSQPDPQMWQAIGQGTTALVTLLNNRLAAGDAERREQRLQEFQLELDRIRREGGGSITTDQNAAITAAMNAVAQQQQAIAAERAAAAEAALAQSRRRSMMLVALVMIVAAVSAAAWYFMRDKQPSARSNPSRGRGGKGGMNAYERYVAKANAAASRAAAR
jgi:hypothetical protein